MSRKSACRTSLAGLSYISDHQEVLLLLLCSHTMQKIKELNIVLPNFILLMGNGIGGGGGGRMGVRGGKRQLDSHVINPALVFDTCYENSEQI